MSLEESDRAAAAVQKTPNRVTLDQLEARIAGEYYATADSFVEGDEKAEEALSALTICVLLLDNGWTLVGKSAPADVRNFNADLGKKFAREAALRELWPLEGYLLRQKLDDEAQDPTT